MILGIAALVLVGFIVIALAWVAGAYNGLVRLRNQLENAWAQIDVQLKRRHDLIPNLVETVKGYATHERETFEKVIQARNMAVNAKTVGDRAEAENVLTGTLKSRRTRISWPSRRNFPRPKTRSPSHASSTTTRS